jgi:glycosyltransferase involved in cell wall biosynthesis
MEGFGWFTNEVFKRIVNQHPEHEFIFIFDRDFDQSFVFGPNVKPVKIGPKARHPWLFYWWYEISIPRILKKFKADVFISPDGYLSLKAAIPQISVMHDLNFEHYPGDLKPHITRYYKKNFPLFAKKASEIITVSNYSKDDIAKQYGIDKGKITVAYNGVDDGFKKSEVLGVNEFKKKFNISQTYYLAVGSIHARKNINRLLQAFDLFKTKTSSLMQLVLVGSKYNWTTEMKNTLETMKFANDVIFTGHLSKNELIHAYSGAYALVFPSYFEGFGIPLIEAMQCECPVICANATSFPEVAGDAALYFDPFNTNDIATKMEEFSNDVNMRSMLVEKGKLRCKLFDWNQTAKIVWSVIEKATNA